ncbi:MAG: hypothetical protein ACTSYF_07325 [Promethearchaeota archaeon]
MTDSMNVNPFNPNVNGEYIYFEHNAKMMKVFLINLLLKDGLTDFIQELVEESSNSNHVHYCLHIQYNKDTFKFFFSMNQITNNLNPINEQVSDFLKFLKRRKSFIKDSNSKKTDLERNYFSLFRSRYVSSFKYNKDTIFLLNSSGKKIGNVAIYKIKLGNLEFIKNFFELIDDIGYKMRLNIDVMIFFWSKNGVLYFSSFMIYNEENEQDFNSTIARLNEIDALKVMLELTKPKKKLISSLFLRRLSIKNAEPASFDLKKYLFNIIEKKIKNKTVLTKKVDDINAKNDVDIVFSKKQGTQDIIHNDNYIIDIDEDFNANDEDFNANDEDFNANDEDFNANDERQKFNMNIFNIDSVNREKFNDLIKSSFKNEKLIKINDEFIEHENFIFLLINGLNISEFKKLINLYKNKKIICLIFLYRNELEEFQRIMPAKVDELYFSTDIKNFNINDFQSFIKKEINISHNLLSI